MDGFKDNTSSERSKERENGLFSHVYVQFDSLSSPPS